jgi:hypothetical protein
MVGESMEAKPVGEDGGAEDMGHYSRKLWLVSSTQPMPGTMAYYGITPSKTRL